MRRVVVVEHLSLDGVMQGPGRPGEDTRGGFELGGWASTRSDDRLSEAMGQHLGPGFEWLLGRRTYDDLLEHWNAEGGSFADGLNQTVKHVVTSRPDSLGWPETQAIGDVEADVADLRRADGGNLVVMGSGVLVRSLLALGLVDELFLMVHPVVLGGGQRLFGAADAPIDFRLEHAESTDGGILLLTYRAASADD